MLQKISYPEATVIPDDVLLEVPKSLRSIFLDRGIDSIHFPLTELLHPFSLEGVQQGVDLIQQLAIDNKKMLLIVGDFDVDGATATTLCLKGFRALGFHSLDFIVPSRFKEGYGLSISLANYIIETYPPALVITVDNGISSISGIALLKSKGFSVIITDHHLPGEELPNADVIINPNSPGSQFQSKNLAGVGVAFYLLLGLRNALRGKDWFTKQSISIPNFADLLYLVALGTLADQVILDHNNRILVYQGLVRIRQGICSEGFKALLRVSNIELSKVTSLDLVWKVAPKINSAGRLSDISKGIHCLLMEKESPALTAANELLAQNLSRKKIQAEMEVQIEGLLQSFQVDDKIVCLYHETFHQGIIGIIASRVKEHCFRPTIIFSKDDEGFYLKGSARSLPGIHFRDFLQRINVLSPGLLVSFGGHAMAAGLKIKLSDYDRFIDLAKQVASESFDASFFQENIHSDGVLSVEAFSLEVASFLKGVFPWGNGFPYPVFHDVFKIIEVKILKEKHLKFLLKKGNRAIEAILFQYENYSVQLKSPYLLAVFELNISTFDQLNKVQLIIKHAISFDSPLFANEFLNRSVNY